MIQKMQPDTINWNKVGKGIYETNCGLYRCEKDPANGGWKALGRVDIDSEFKNLTPGYVWLALWVAQGECSKVARNPISIHYIK